MEALYHPPMLARPDQITITPWSYQSLGVPLYAMNSGALSTAAAWPAANLVIFVPFGVVDSMTVVSMFYGIGAAAGNVDAGIYDESQKLLVSIGTTVAAGATTLQTLNITDTTLARGRYYMALVADTVTTLTIYRTAPAIGIAQSLGLLEQASVTLPLSTNASPAVFAKYTRAFVPLVGIQGYRTIGP